MSLAVPALLDMAQNLTEHVVGSECIMPILILITDGISRDLTVLDISISDAGASSFEAHFFSQARQSIPRS